MGEDGVVIHLRLFGFGARQSRFRHLTVPLAGGACVASLLAWCREEARIDLPDYLVVFVNGREAKQLQGEQTPLSDGDEVTIMRPVAGGGGGALSPHATADGRLGAWMAGDRREGVTMAEANQVLCLPALGGEAGACGATAGMAQLPEAAPSWVEVAGSSGPARLRI